MIPPDDPTLTSWSGSSELIPTSMPRTTDADFDDDDVRVIPTAAKAILGAGLVLIVALATTGNGIVCFIVLQKPSMRSAINLLLANMALSSILLAITVMPFAFCALITDRWMIGDVMCQIEGFLHSLFVSEAGSMLFIITVDRYLIVVKKRDRLTPLRAKRTIAASWLLSCCVTFPPLVGWGAYTSYSGWMMCVLAEYDDAVDQGYVVFHYTVLFFVPVLMLAYLYGAIVRTVHRHSRRVHNHPDELASPAIKLGLVLPGPTRISANLNCKMRAFKTILLLFVLFVVCWIPYAVSLIVWNSGHRISDNYLAGTVLIWIGYLNSALDPIVYCWRISKFREACCAILPRSLQGVPLCTSRVRRRINPGSIYEQRDSQQNQLQELQVQSYLASQNAITSA